MEPLLRSQRPRYALPQLALPLAFLSFQAFPFVCAPLLSSRKCLRREGGWSEAEGCHLLHNEFISSVLVAEPTVPGCAGMRRCSGLASHPLRCFAGQGLAAQRCLLLGFWPLGRAVLNPART